MYRKMSLRTLLTVFVALSSIAVSESGAMSFEAVPRSEPVIPVSVRSGKVNVSSQGEFDGLSTTIKTALSMGYNMIEVNFAPGLYYFRERHLELKNLNYPAATIVFNGNGAFIAGEGEDYVLRPSGKHFSAAKRNYDYRNALVDVEARAELPPFGPMKQAQGRVEVVDASSKTCRFKTSEPNLSSTAAGNLYVQISKWYLGAVYKVQKIQNGYVYFTAPDLSNNGSYYNVDADWYFGKKHPKYQFLNYPGSDVYVQSGKLVSGEKRTIHECVASQFAEISSCKFKLLEFKDLNFIGNGPGVVSEPMLIHFFSLPGKTVVDGCTFSGIRTRVISSRHNDGASYYGNTITGCYEGFIFIDRESVGTQVYSNLFHDTQLYLKNSVDVYCRGGDFHIHDNEFRNFTCMAIGVGDHFTTGSESLCSGIVENNEIYYTEDYLKEPSHTLMDSGAIYCWTKQKDVTIRNNYIHDYGGTYLNRGIFGDDGTVNVKVYGNVITGIRNSYCIDFRRCANVETQSNSNVRKTNVGIQMYDNLVDGTVRFEPRSGDRTSRKGSNKSLKTAADKASAAVSWKERYRKQP